MCAPRPTPAQGENLSPSRYAVGEPTALEIMVYWSSTSSLTATQTVPSALMDTYSIAVPSSILPHPILYYFHLGACMFHYSLANV